MSGHVTRIQRHLTSANRFGGTTHAALLSDTDPQPGQPATPAHVQRAARAAIATQGRRAGEEITIFYDLTGPAETDENRIVVLPDTAVLVEAARPRAAGHLVV